MRTSFRGGTWLGPKSVADGQNEQRAANENGEDYECGFHHAASCFAPLSLAGQYFASAANPSPFL